MKKGNSNEVQLSYLTDVSSGMEANIIESKLKAYGIPILKKTKGTGGYLQVLMGDTMLGVDIYVPSNSLEKAKEIINDIQETDNEYVSENKEEVEINDLDGDKYERKRRLYVILIILFFIPGVIWIFGLLIKLIIEMISRI